MGGLPIAGPAPGNDHEILRTFSEGDHRFQIGLRRGQPADFFRPTNSALLDERRDWLSESGGARSLYAGLLSEGMPMLDECLHLAQAWGSITPEAAARCMEAGSSSTLRPAECCARLGENWEPDFLLVRADDGFALAGGCVCFPSAWSLEGKAGLPLAAIHSVVPGLNASLGQGISILLSRLTPGTAYLRHNWGLSRSPELNQHPIRNLPRLTSGVTLGEIWLRVEHQSLVLLPESGGILFGIRISMHPLTEVCQDTVAAERLARSLLSMEEDVAAYKGLASCRAKVAALLAETLGRHEGPDGE